MIVPNIPVAHCRPPLPLIAPRTTSDHHRHHEWNDPSARTHAVFENPPKPVDGMFHLPDGPVLGLRVNEAELAKRRVG
jgi:L-alanine-DL-glutamate epimerase-like enolase superfamily enzyme